MSERKKHIAVLKEMLEWMNMSSEVIKKDDPFFRVHEHRKKAVKYAISSLETDEAYQLEYEKPEICEDCISRKEIIDRCNIVISHGLTDKEGMHPISAETLLKETLSMPSVLPKAEVHEDCVPRKIVERIIKSPRSQEQMLTILNIIPSVLPKADKPTIIDWNNCHTSEQLDSISTTKNDFAVDYIDRQATLDAIIKRLGIKNETYLLEAERAIYQQILAMPSVTPIRPKGHWIDHSDDGYVECPKCGSATNCDDNINDLHFCFSCGAMMVEPQESEET